MRIKTGATGRLLPRYMAGLVLIGGLLLTACVTAVRECPPEPDWISSPEQEGYYVGVGSADSGNQAEDRPVAEARAKADLAARISVQITSEMAVATSASSSGEYSQQVEELVNQSVEKNIEDIETVDTYYCRSMGYWVYVRLSKERWREIQEQRRQEVLQRVKDLIDPVLADPDSSVAERMERLQRGYELINTSSLGEKIDGEVAGQKGNISDTVISLLNSHVADLRIALERSSVSLEIGEALSLNGRVYTSLSGKPGMMELLVTDSEGKEILSTQCGEDGDFSIQVPEGFRAAGEQRLFVQPRIDEAAARLLFNPPAKTEVVLRVEKITAGFIVEVENSQVGRTVEKEVRAIFSDRDLPFEFVDRENTGGYNLQVSIFVEDYPRVMENAPLMARAWAVVSLLKNGKALYSYESQPVKDGGIDLNQSHSRVLSTLMTALRQDDILFQRLTDALGES